ncbi:MAG: hypothetical protein JST28_19760 [Acidobacteria bacterium]|nr:hypothetical protein [Acidobacteriota bacterium]
MRIRRYILTMLVALAPVALYAQENGSSTVQNTLKFVGVWRGQFDNLPGADLVIDNEGGSLHGAIVFYLHKRPDTSSPYTSTPGLPGPLLNVHAVGKTLHFQLSHRLAHPPSTLHDPLMDFHLTITGPDQGALGNDSESSLGLAMKRSDY